MQCNAMQCNAMQCNTIQYNTIQDYTSQDHSNQLAGTAQQLLLLQIYYCRLYADMQYLLQKLRQRLQLQLYHLVVYLKQFLYI